MDAVRTLASITKAAIDAFSDQRDATSQSDAHPRAWASGRPDAAGLAAAIKFSAQSSRALIDEIERQARDQRAQLQTSAFRLDDAIVADAYSFEREFFGFASGVRDGVMILSPAWEPPVMPWLCHRLQDFLSFDIATFRVTGSGLAHVISAPLLIRNRVLTAFLSARAARELVPAAQLLLLRNTRAARLKQRACVLAQPRSRIAQLSAELAETLALQPLA